MSTTASPITYDSIVIGSGQAGSPLATALAKAGRRTLLIEKEHVGVAVLRICPSEDSSLAWYRRLSRWSGSENRLKVAGVDVMMGKASFVGEMNLTVDMSDGKEEQPAIPDMSGVKETMKDAPGRILDSTSIQELDEIPKTLIVIGGGPVGLEFAQLFKRLGSQVHIMQRSKQLLPREDPEIVQTLFDILIEEGLDISCGAEIKSMAYHPHSDLPIQITIKSSSDESDSYIAGTHILLATGRRPNTDLLNLAATNVTTNTRGYIQTSPSLETTCPGIYALAFDKRINHHTTDPRKKLIPYVIFTDPQLAHVGLHLHDIPLSARADIKIAKMPMSYVARALEIDEARGMMKAVVNGVTGEILGFSCLSTEGGELMSIVQCAMMGGVKWWDLREAIWAHPTWAECLNNLWGFLEDV
ncbi:putative pyridine nucleotide-disulfide oxidoreductase RclA [Venturia nashicola]|uniref:Putative pyridine nucleotide-disulfide oxidoreductase RclA n=1 Tax=Venturia nashicola TaxID=86259 RepID=A0A4Z1PIF8_9PEZI|nr:putative pyridine nucleotide-disulfide oxidoreductase RclA [Venturia nashicola]